MTDQIRQRIIDTAQVLCHYGRIAVAGGPLSGKSLFADEVLKSFSRPDRGWIETDTFKELPWAEQPKAIIEACHQFDSFIVTGVQVGRVLRAGLRVDVAVWLVNPLQELTKEQKAMQKGCWSIFAEWKRNPTAGYVIV